MEEYKAINLRQRADALCQKKPCLIIQQIRQYEQNHFLVVSEKYGRFISQFEVFYDLITEILFGLNYIDHSAWPKYRSMQLLLINHNLKTLYSAFSLLTRGFWADSLNLVRTTYEALIRAMWISCYPMRAGAAIHEYRDGGREFNLTGFLKDDLGLHWDSYKFLSMLSHANQPAVMRDWIGIHTKIKKEPIAIEFEFDKKYFEVALNYILFVSFVYLKIILRLFVTSHNEILKKEDIDDAEELADIWKETLLSHPGGYWPVLVKDFEDILTIIEGVDNGKDWKILWSKLRTSPIL